MSSLPLITIYIATHNRAELLMRAVESALMQTYANIEVIVADDCSTDNTRRLLQPLVDAKRVRYVFNASPMGACVARNQALDIAKGEYITGMDDDDVLEPWRVEKLFDAFQEGDYSCVASSIRERTPNGDIVRQLDVGEVTLDQLLHHNILGNQVFTKTSYLRSIGGFDPKMPAFQDYDTWVRLLNKFGTGKKLSDPSYVWFTDHSLGRISENSSRKLIAFEMFVAKHKPLFSSRHIQSMEVLRKRLAGQQYTIFDFCKYTNRNNWKQSLTLFIHRNLKFVKQIFDSLRVKKT